MQRGTGERLIAASATLAALIAALDGLLGIRTVLVWDPAEPLVVTAAVLGGLAALVALVAGVRARDRRLVAIGVSTLVLALSSAAPSFVVEVVSVVAQGALIAFGVLVVRSEQGVQRALGWLTVVAAALWFLTWLLFGAVPVLALVVPQEALDLVFALPSALQTVAYLVATVLVAVPLLGRVRAGAGALWDSAEVR